MATCNYYTSPAGSRTHITAPLGCSYGVRSTNHSFYPPT